jgi:hypothetical protein
MWDLIGGAVKSQELSAERFSGPASYAALCVCLPLPANQPAVTYLVV